MRCNRLKSAFARKALLPTIPQGLATDKSLEGSEGLAQIPIKIQFSVCNHWIQDDIAVGPVFKHFKTDTAGAARGHCSNSRLRQDDNGLKGFCFLVLNLSWRCAVHVKSCFVNEATWHILCAQIKCFYVEIRRKLQGNDPMYTHSKNTCLERSHT